MEHMFQKCPISFSYKHATFYSSSLLSSMHYVPLALFSRRSLESFESNASPTTTVADKWLLIKVKHTWNNTSCTSKHTCTSCVVACRMFSKCFKRGLKKASQKRKLVLCSS